MYKMIINDLLSTKIGKCRPHDSCGNKIIIR